MSNMSDSFEEIIQDFNDSPEVRKHDTEFVNIISVVQSINETLENDPLPITSSELRRRVQEVNRRWKKYLNGKSDILVTGNVYLGASYIETEETVDDEFIQVQDEHSTSLIYYPVYNVGFAAINNTYLNEQQEVAGEQRIVYTANISLGTTDEEGDEYTHLCMVRPEDIVAPYEKSTPVLADIELQPMQESHFNFTKFIIESAADECEATTGLRDVVMLPEIDYRTAENYREFLNEFLAKAVQYNQHMPYLAEIKGEVGVFDTVAIAHMPLYVHENTPIALSRPELIADIDDDGTSRLTLKAIWLKADTQDVTIIQIPLDSLQYIASGNELFNKYL